MKETTINPSNSQQKGPPTPEEGLARLKEGNERFLHGREQPRELLEEVQRTGTSQSPFAVVLSCIDSRVPPEIIFDQGVGDLLTARVAGPVVNEDVLGSLEFGLEFTPASLIVVLGHTNCGAIMGAADGVELGHLTGLLTKIKAALDQVSVEGPPSSKNEAFIRAAAVENVVASIKQIQNQSKLISNRVQSGEVMLAGALYDVASGRVEFL